MKNVFISFNFFCILILISSCSSSIKTVTAYEDVNGVLEKKTETEFDKKGNELKEIKYGKTYDKIKATTYYKNSRVSVLNCDFQKDVNRCIANSFSKFTYDAKKKTETETMYVKDSLVWRIEEKRELNNLEIIKTYNWDIEATKIPNYDEAFVTLDSLFYDKKSRLIRKVSHNKIRKPFEDIYTYTKNGYSYQIKGTRMDTIYNYKYSKEQKIIVNQIPRFEFYYPKQLVYKIEYY